MLKSVKILNLSSIDYNEGTTNLKVNLDTISLRARELIADPRFFSENIKTRFSVSLDEKGRILSIRHGKDAESSLLDISFLFSEVLAKFGLHKTIPEIWSIPFREIESFLRDENHLPAFGDSVELVEKSWAVSKACLVAETVLASFGSELKVLKEQISKWEELSLAGKNALMSKILSVLGWELILYAEETMTVRQTPKEIENVVLERTIHEIFRVGGKVLPMKVVAVQ